MKKRNDPIVEHVARLPRREKPTRKRRRERRAAERESRGLIAEKTVAGSWGAVWDRIDSTTDRAEEAHGVDDDPETADPPRKR